MNQISQIEYTEAEVRITQLADIYTTSDGYIFDEHECISDEGRCLCNASYGT